VSIIIMSNDDQGGRRGEPHEIADELLDINPDAVVRLVKGPISGALVDDATAVRWLMQRYTASGNVRKGK
jgi:hypothetical protein